MKLVLQITAGIVLAWAIINGAEALLAHTALPQLHAPLPDLTKDRITNNSSSEKPPPPSREQQESQIRAELQREIDAQHQNPAPQPAPLIRKATPDDAKAKPAQ